MKKNIDIYYDIEGDFLELGIGNPVPSYYEKISDGVFLGFDDKTNKIIGFTLSGFKIRAEKNDIWYDKEEDIINIKLSNEKYYKSIELQNIITLDIAKDDSIITIKILKASEVFSGEFKKVLELVKEIA